MQLAQASALREISENGIRKESASRGFGIAVTESLCSVVLLRMTALSGCSFIRCPSRWGPVPCSVDVREEVIPDAGVLKLRIRWSGAVARP